MADFDTLESSLEESNPIEIYVFAMGSDKWRYTSRGSDVSVGATVYEYESIARGNIVQGSDDRNRTLSITVPETNPFAQQYVNVAPASKATVSIIRLQRDESPTFATQTLIYKGQVQSVVFPKDGTVAEIAVRSLDAARSQTIPRVTYMSSCNHLLYDNFCKIDPASHDHTGAASGVTGSLVTVAGLNASGIDAVGGYATTTSANDYRLIIAQTGDQIELLLPFGTDPTGGNVQVFAGCDHILTGDCANTFDNVLEFGGFAFVPNRNPFKHGLIHAMSSEL